MLQERILRFSLGIVFVWMGILIVQNGDPFSASVAAWVGERIPWGLSMSQVLLGVGIFDIVMGLWLLFGLYPKIAASIAALHLAVVLVVTSKSLHEVHIAEIGLLGAAISLALTRQTVYFED